MESSFATTHMFCTSHDGLRMSYFLRKMPTNSKVFLQVWFMIMQKTKILARAIGTTMHFQRKLSFSLEKNIIH